MTKLLSEKKIRAIINHFKDSKVPKEKLTRHELEDHLAKIIGVFEVVGVGCTREINLVSNLEV